MSKQKRILLTGATGTVGSQVAKQMHCRGADITLAVRQPQVFHGWMAEAAIPFDYLRPETFETILSGYQKLFIISPPSPQNVEGVRQLLHVARQVGMEHVVAVTGMGAPDRKNFSTAATDSYVREAGIPWTLLRPNWFMQNFFTHFHADIISRGELFLPVADSKTSFIDVRDIAEVATTVLLSDDYAHQAFALTGSESLTHDEVANAITSISGRKVTCPQVSEQEYILALQKQQWSEKSISEMVQLFREMREGKTAPVSHAVEQILGRRPYQFEQFVQDHASRWQ